MDVKLEDDDERLYEGVGDGLMGIIEATRREAVQRGGFAVRVERRVVGPWEPVE